MISRERKKNPKKKNKKKKKVEKERERVDFTFQCGMKSFGMMNKTDPDEKVEGQAFRMGFLLFEMAEIY